jgi:phosphoribosylformylglycinamidine synthase
VDLAHEQALGRLMAQASEREHIVAAHDLSDGGLAQVLVESCLRRNVGARIMLPEHDAAVTPFVWLFSESAGRALVAVPRGHDKAFVALAAEHNVSCVQIGVTAEEPVLDIHNQFTIGLDEVRAAFTATMRNLFGGPAEGVTRQIAAVIEAGESSAAEPAAEVTAEDDDRATGPSVTLEISEPAHPASGPAEEVAEVPSRSDTDPATTEPATTEPASTEPAAKPDDEPESKA